MTAQPELFDCTGCTYQAKVEALWVENADAWRMYQTLCGRTVGMLEGGWSLLDRLTEGWTEQELLDLLQRLDVILNVLQPRDEASTHGRSPAT